MIKALIVEDEIQSRKLLYALLEKNCPEIKVVALAANVKEALEAVQTHQPNLVFLDITMPDGTGFDFLEKTPAIKFDIIFTTATDKYAVKAIKYSALDYLLKPIDNEELKHAVEKMIQKKQQLNTVENLAHLLQNIKQSTDSYQKITLPTGGSYEIVLVKDIIRCEAEGSYTHFFFPNKKKILATSGLKYYEDLLPPNYFMRIHNHHLINLNHVVRYLKNDGGFAIMSDETKIEVSRRKKDDFLNALKQI
ncbi:MAG: response regulator transcription factor [Bacteroidetes bacterium]|nr:response regulator transcription factor [Bacteroidota bacterium]